MARFNGLIQFVGSLGGVTADKNGVLSMTPAKRAITAQRTKDNNSEFGNAASAAKRLMDGLSKLSKVGKGKYLFARLLKVMKEAINLDLVSVRGQRNVLDGEVAVLEGFNFNDLKSIASLLVVTISATIARATGVCEVIVPAFTPINDLNAPGGTTHFKIVAESASVNFETGETDSKTAETGYLPLNATLVPVTTLSMNLVDGSTDPIFTGVAIEYYQFMNGDYYILEDKSFNAATILKVDTGV